LAFANFAWDFAPYFFDARYLNFDLMGWDQDALPVASLGSYGMEASFFNPVANRDVSDAQLFSDFIDR